MNKRMGLCPSFGLGPHLGQRPDQGPSPLVFFRSLRRGVAPPHVRRRSRFGSSAVIQPNLLTVLPLSKKPLWSKLTGSQDRNNKGCNSRPNKLPSPPDVRRGYAPPEVFMNKRMGLCPSFGLGPHLGQRPDQGPSPLVFFRSLRRGVAPPHVRRRSRFGSSAVIQPNLLTVLPLSKKPLWSKLTGSQDRNNKGCNSRPNKLRRRA